MIGSSIIIYITTISCKTFNLIIFLTVAACHILTKSRILLSIICSTHTLPYLSYITGVPILRLLTSEFNLHVPKEEEERFSGICVPHHNLSPGLSLGGKLEPKNEEEAESSSFRNMDMVLDCNSFKLQGIFLGSWIEVLFSRGRS